MDEGKQEKLPKSNFDNMKKNDSFEPEEMQNLRNRYDY